MSDFVPRFRAKIEDRQFKFATDYNEARFKEFLRTLEGKEVVITVQRKTTQRSNKQNNYYWGAIIPLIMDHMGETEPREVDRVLRGMFLTRTKTVKAVDVETGETIKESSLEIPDVPSSKELTVGEFVEFLMKVEAWAIPFFGIERWPDPEEWELRDIMI